MKNIITLNRWKVNALEIKRLYKKHQAFNDAHNEIDKETCFQEDCFELAKKYHHNPNKLSIFKHYSHYLNWLNRLYSATKCVIEELEKILKEAKSVKPCLIGSKSKLNKILMSLDEIGEDLIDLRNDILEFENCMLATRIDGNYGYVDAISSQRKHIDFLETRIFETCNQKLNGISSLKISIIGIFVGVSALVVAIVALSLN